MGRKRRQRSDTLVGRASEVAELDHGLNRVGTGEPWFVHLAGKAAIGKTRLLAKLGRRAEQRGWLVLDGRAAEFERDVPFGLMIDALNDYMRGLEPALLRSLDDDALAELANLPISFQARGRRGSPGGRLGALPGPMRDPSVLGLLECDRPNTHLAWLPLPQTGRMPACGESKVAFLLSDGRVCALRFRAATSIRPAPGRELAEHERPAHRPREDSRASMNDVAVRSPAAGAGGDDLTTAGGREVSGLDCCSSRRCTSTRRPWPSCSPWTNRGSGT